MSERNLELLLSDIKGSITKILEYTRGMTFESYEADSKTIRLSGIMSQKPLYFVVFTQLQFYSSQVSLNKRPKMDSTSNTKFETVNEYMSALPESTRVKLEKLRQTIKKAAPQAEEVISYNMPAYKQEGMLVYYAAYKGHIGFYPTASPIKAFKEELADYSGSKGTVRFPLDKPIPSGLVSRIVKYKVKENLEKAHAKTMKKTTTKGRK